jgi:hypothetical protein
MMNNSATRFEDTPLFDLYLNELARLAHSVVRACEQAFDIVIPTDAMDVRHLPDLHAKIIQAISDAAKLGRLIAPDHPRTKYETEHQYDMRLARLAYFQNRFQSIDLSNLLDRGVRNTVEHFDEYLDRANAGLQKPGRSLPVLAASNLIVSHAAVFKMLRVAHEGPQGLLPTRWYIAAERKLYNFGKTIDLQGLHDESEAILAVVAPLAKGNKEWGPPDLITFRVPPTD